MEYKMINVELEAVIGVRVKHKNGELTTIGEALKQFPVERGWNDEYKLEHMVLILNKLYHDAKLKIRGLFTEKEAWALISSFNGFVYTPSNDDKEVLLRMLKGFLTYEYIPDDEYAINGNEFYKKIENLDTVESFAVIRMALEFWDRMRNPFGGEELLKEIFGID